MQDSVLKLQEAEFFQQLGRALQTTDENTAPADAFIVAWWDLE